MSLQFYNSWRIVSSTPSEYYKESLQALIDEQFENASSLATIQEEQTFGKFDWSDDLQVRITHILSDKNTGEKLGDDFRNIIFSDMTHPYSLGKRYSFSDNYWITTNTDIYKYPTASVCIRRCNNVLNNYDEYGILHTEPCIIDYQIRSADFDYNTNIILPDGMKTIIVQGNEWTKNNYKINKRFMFGGQSWKCTEINNYQRTNTLNSSSVNIIRMIVIKDNIAPDDDVINNIPNASTYNYTITIDQGTSLSQNIGYSSQLTTTVKNGETIVNETVILFNSSDESIVSVDSNTGLITLLKEGSATITASLKDNPSVNSSIIVTVTNVVLDTYDIVISPNVTSLLQGELQAYTVKQTKNSVDTSEVLVIQDISIGIPSGYYTFTSGVNTFTITNIKRYAGGNVVIKVGDSLNNSKEISIQLLGSW